jgi:hypothetical protein
VVPIGYSTYNGETDPSSDVFISCSYTLFSSTYLSSFTAFDSSSSVTLSSLRLGEAATGTDNAINKLKTINGDVIF